MIISGVSWAVGVCGGRGGKEGPVGVGKKAGSNHSQEGVEKAYVSPYSQPAACQPWLPKETMLHLLIARNMFARGNHVLFANHQTVIQVLVQCGICLRATVHRACPHAPGGPRPPYQKKKGYGLSPASRLGAGSKPTAAAWGPTTAG